MALINKLPDELLEEILTRVPIQDAVKTSVLSTRWRNVWKKIPTLAFDDSFCTRRTRILRRTEAIYQVMLLHDGPILNFSFSLSDPESCSMIDLLLLVISKRGIKKITLRIQKGKTYRLPSSIFSCQQLEHLELSDCTFGPLAGFKGFSKLVSLKLDQVSMDGRLLSSLIRYCPLLETLDFRSTTLYDSLELFAPNLKHLKITGLSKILCLRNTPKLTSVELHLGDSISETSRNCLIFGTLPGIEDLTLDYYYAELYANMTSIYASKSLVGYLCNLKRLCLWDICFRASTDVSSIVTLIRSCPKLEKLVIHVDIDRRLTDSVSIDGWDFVLHQLRQVELTSVSGSKCELQFIKLLLKNSPKLEKIVLQPELEKIMGKAIYFYKELSTFRRASPLAEIVYGLPDVSDDW